MFADGNNPSVSQPAGEKKAVKSRGEASKKGKSRTGKQSRRREMCRIPIGITHAPTFVNFFIFACHARRDALRSLIQDGTHFDNISFNIVNICLRLRRSDFSSRIGVRRAAFPLVRFPENSQGKRALRCPSSRLSSARRASSTFEATRSPSRGSVHRDLSYSKHTASTCAAPQFVSICT